MRSLRETRLHAIAQLIEVSQTPALDVDLLLCHVLLCDQVGLILRDAEILSEDVLKTFEALLLRRLNQEPIAYICGEKEFMGLNFKVCSDVLIPRPDTEILVEAILAHIPEGEALKLLDIGTGSGAILISLLAYRTKCSGVAVDISKAALDVARQNAQAIDVENRVEWIESDLFSQLDKRRFDWIVSNPPYIDGPDMDRLEPNVAEYEPHLALFGGEDGLEFYRRIIHGASAHLAPQGFIAFEIGYDQRVSVEQLLEQSGYESITCYNDLAGHDRAIIARLKPNRG